jgi:hypothetical protein
VCQTHRTARSRHGRHQGPQRRSHSRRPARHCIGTAAELAEAAGIGRSTAGKALAMLEAEGYAIRQRSTPPPGTKNAPEHWTLTTQTPSGAADTRGKSTPEAEPTGRLPAPEQLATTPAEGADQPNDKGAPRPATAAPSATGKTTGAARLTTAHTVHTPDRPTTAHGHHPPTGAQRPTRPPPHASSGCGEAPLGVQWRYPAAAPF